jgi:hypothetical protein
MPELDLALLRALKGAPLSCLLAMLVAGHPVGAVWLESATGYSRQAVGHALGTLKTLHAARCLGRYESWELSESVRGLSLPRGRHEIHTSPVSSSGSSFSADKDLLLPAPSAAREKNLTSPVYGYACIAENRPCARRALKFARWPDDIFYLERLIHERHPEHCYHCEHKADGCPFAAPDYGDWAIQAEVERAEHEAIDTALLVWRIKAVISGERPPGVPASHRKQIAEKRAKMTR